MKSRRHLVARALAVPDIPLRGDDSRVGAHELGLAEASPANLWRTGTHGRMGTIESGTARMLGVVRTPCIGIVEDDVAIRETVADVVRSEGFAAAPFEDAASLFRALDSSIVLDLIVLDLKLPDRDG